MLTTFDLEDYVYAALRAGASGFLLKDAPAEQLVEAIEVVARGDAQLAPQVTQAAHRGGRQAAAPSPPPRGRATLTERETEVLRADGAGPVERRDRRRAVSSARRPSRPTSGGSSPSSAPAIGSRPS